MNPSSKTQPHHLERAAYLYVRQSSMRQVMENVESSKRQYALRGRAVALGWKEEQIVVIDSDQGESGASASWREGFQRLVSDVGMGRAGIVMGLEVSRLARNNADWHRLLEICALADTLILDEDGVYDPASFNDRLLLGLKGTMSEAELHVIKARLRGGILNKVRRGEYRCVLPTGLVYDEAGDVVLDPDAQVRETIMRFFETFERLGTASQTVKAFRKEGLCVPSRAYNRNTVVFQPLTASTAMRMLTNPRYAGTYAYGRRMYRRSAEGKKLLRARKTDDWLACIPNAHPGYITWEQFQHNLDVLKSNGRGFASVRASPPREGAALLQGRAVCGRCGRHLSVHYAARRGKIDTWYVCCRAYGARGEPSCQTIAGWPIDEAVSELITAAMTPAAVDLAIEVRKEIEDRHDEADRLRLRAVERAHVEAELAQRRFMLVDPGNRLVADTLEHEWNEKLRTLSAAQEERERGRERDRLAVDVALRERLAAMTRDFKELWQDPGLPNRERKRLLAHIIEDVTLLKLPEAGLTRTFIRFKGGKTETVTTENPKSSAQQITTKPEVVEMVDALLDTKTYPEIADILNQRAIRPGGSSRKGKADAQFSALKVAYLVKEYDLRPRFERLRAIGMLSSKEAAARLGITVGTLVRWARHGLVQRHAHNGHAYLYEIPQGSVPAKHSSRWDRLADRAAKVSPSRDQNATLESKELQCEAR